MVSLAVACGFCWLLLCQAKLSRRAPEQPCPDWLQMMVCLFKFLIQDIIRGSIGSFKLGKPSGL